MERLSVSKDVAGHKLLILYILKKLNIAVAGIDLTNYILEERLMRFATFQQRIHELVAADHIICVSVGGFSRYEITESGSALISNMSDLIPQTEKNRIDRTVRKLNRRAINNRSVSARYTPKNEKSGAVRIELNEGEMSVLSLEIATASRHEALIICENWKSRAAEIYAGIVELLLEQPPENPDGQPPENLDEP